MDDDMATKMMWMKYAACKGLPVDLFMPKRGEISKIKEARKICAGCPVLKACRDYSIEAAQEADLDGVFGGWTKLERMKYMRSKGLHFRRMGYSNQPMPTVERRDANSHGTASAYRRHIKAHEEPCQECLESHQERLYRIASYQRKRVYQ